jgi:hypothetical protein
MAAPCKNKIADENAGIWHDMHPRSMDRTEKMDK